MKPGTARRLLLFGVALLATLLASFHYVYRPWQMNWGATPEEISRPMAGDEIVEAPNFDATRAVTVDAPAERIWPWIVQIGYRRAGFYSWDILGARRAVRRPRRSSVDAAHHLNELSRRQRQHREGGTLETPPERNRVHACASREVEGHHGAVGHGQAQAFPNAASGLDRLGLVAGHDGSERAPLEHRRERPAFLTAEVGERPLVCRPASHQLRNRVPDQDQPTSVLHLRARATPPAL